MRAAELEIRALVAAFYAQPAFVQWARSRARELRALNEAVTVVVEWGPWCVTAEDVPDDEPTFAIRRADGTLERSPWASKR